MIFNKRAKIIQIDYDNPNQDIIDQVGSTMSKGGLIIYPSDSYYVLGVNAYNELGTKRLYNVKEKSETKPTHVVIRDWNMMSGITITNDAAEALYDKFMPGPITLILQKKEKVPISDLLTGGLTTLGVRIPNCKVTQAISQVVKFPYTTSSANRSGEKTPYSVSEVLEVLGDEGIDFILDAGPLPEKPSSVIVDLSSEVYKILRYGEISHNEIMSVLRETYKRKQPIF